MSPDELMSLAREIRNRINTAADGRLPYDMPSGGPQLGYGEANPVRGSLNGRDFAIPTANVLKYVHTDMEHVVPAYLRTIIPDLHLMKRFGDVEMSEQFKKVNEWYDGLAAKETDAKKLMKIDASRKAEVRDLAATRDRIRGVYGMPTNQTQRNFGRVARAVGNWNVGTFLGTSMLNRFQDMANATARRGLLGYMGDGFLPFIKGARGSTPAPRQPPVHEGHRRWRRYGQRPLGVALLGRRQQPPAGQPLRARPARDRQHGHDRHWTHALDGHEQADCRHGGVR